MSDYTANPALDKLVTEVGGTKNLDNNAVNSFVSALLFQDAVEKATANGGTLDRQTLFNALNNDESSFDAEGIIGPVNIGARASSDCSVLVQLHERGVAAGGPDQARDLRLQPGQPRHPQDEHRLVAGRACNTPAHSAATAECARLPAPRPYRPHPRSSQ